MNADDFMAMMQNAVNWCNEGKGRRIVDVKYEPNCAYPRPPSIFVFDSELLDGQTITSPADIIDVPAAGHARKIEEFRRLQKELGL